LFESICIGAILIAIRNAQLEGPSLALVILFIHSSSHFLLGGGTYQNENRMTAAHLLSGVISYLAISSFEEAWEIVSSAFVVLLPNLPFQSPTIPEFFQLEVLVRNLSFQIRRLTASLKFRGPPNDWAK
jgi:hypothetical protein